MLRYALSTLRARKGGFIGAFLALFCAAMLVTACGALLETGLRGPIVPERYAGTAVVVSGDQEVHETTVEHRSKGRIKLKTKSKPLAERAWIPADTVDRLRGLPGAAAVTPELTFPAYAVSPQGQVVPGVGGKASEGHGWTSAVLTPFTLVDGAAPERADQVVVDRELAARLRLRPGQELTVASTQGPQRFTVSGIAAARGGDLAEQSSLFFSDTQAARLAGHPGQVSAIGIAAAPGVSADTLTAEARRALAGTTAQVHSGADLGPVEFLDAADARVRLVSMGAALGGTSLLVAVLVVVGTFALTIGQRRRELALLRAVAATPRQVRRLIGREALLVGALAGVPGVLAGLPLAVWLHGRFVALGAVPDTVHLAVSVFPPLIAFAVTLLAAWSAARISARRISRIRPAEALGEAAIEPGTSWVRLALGAVAVAGGVVLLLVLSGLDTEAGASPVTFVTVIVFAIAVALLGPVIARLAAAVLGVPLRLSRVGGHLAAANTRAGARQAAGAITPLVLLIAMTATVLFVPATLGGAVQAQARTGDPPDHVVAAPAAGLPDRALAALRDTPGVTAVTAVLHSEVHVGTDKFTAEGVSAPGLTQNVDLGLVAGSVQTFGDGDVALSQVAASSLGKRPGDTLALTLGDGAPVTLTVDAIYQRGLGFGDLTVTQDLLAHHVDNPLPASALVKGPADAAALTAVLRPYPGVAVLRPADAVQAARAASQAEAAVNVTAMGLILAFTAIAAANTLAMTVAGRGREFTLLRLVGTTRRQLRGMLRLETALVITAAATLGSTIALAVLTAFASGMTGTPSPAIDPLRAVAILAAAATLALGATLIPARLRRHG